SDNTGETAIAPSPCCLDQPNRFSFGPGFLAPGHSRLTDRERWVLPCWTEPHCRHDVVQRAPGLHGAASFADTFLCSDLGIPAIEHFHRHDARRQVAEDRIDIGPAAFPIFPRPDRLLGPLVGFAEPIEGVTDTVLWIKLARGRNGAFSSILPAG